MSEPLVNEIFQCEGCSRVLPYSRQNKDGVTHLIGVVEVEPFWICYDCAARQQVDLMIKWGVETLYLQSQPVSGGRWESQPLSGDWAEWYAVNFTHTLEFRCHQSPNVRKHNIAGSVRYVYFTGPDGAKWSGRCYGENELLHCKRLKRQRKNISCLHPAQYQKPYPYGVSTDSNQQHE